MHVFGTWRGVISEKRFATALACIDGRFHEHLVAWIRQEFGVDHVDLITEAGIDRQLLVGDDALRANIRRRVTVSHTAHASRVLVIAAHEDCAGNPCARDRHEAYVAGCIELASTWNLPMQLVGVFQDTTGSVTPFTTVEPH